MKGFQANRADSPVRLMIPRPPRAPSNEPAAHPGGTAASLGAANIVPIARNPEMGVWPPPAWTAQERDCVGAPSSSDVADGGARLSLANPCEDESRTAGQRKNNGATSEPTSHKTARPDREEPANH